MFQWQGGRILLFSLCYQVLCTSWMHAIVKWGFPRCVECYSSHTEGGTSMQILMKSDDKNRAWQNFEAKFGHFWCLFVYLSTLYVHFIVNFYIFRKIRWCTIFSMHDLSRTMQHIGSVVAGSRALQDPFLAILREILHFHARTHYEHSDRCAISIVILRAENLTRKFWHIIINFRTQILLIVIQFFKFWIRRWDFMSFLLPMSIFL